MRDSTGRWRCETRDGGGEWSGDEDCAARVCLDPEDTGDRKLIRDVCRITHHNEEAYVGALAVVMAVRSPSHLLERLVSNLPDSRVRDRISEFSSLQDVSIATQTLQ